MLYVGYSELVIDAKARLAVPARYRAQWDPTADGKHWVLVPWERGLLRLYTEVGFSQLVAQMKSSLTPSPERARLQAALFGFAEAVEMDGAGRIVIPKHQLERTGLSGEVVMIGSGDRFEIRAKGAWKSGEDELFASLPSLAQDVERSEGPAGREK